MNYPLTDFVVGILARKTGTTPSQVRDVLLEEAQTRPPYPIFHARVLQRLLQLKSVADRVHDRGTQAELDNLDSQN